MRIFEAQECLASLDYADRGAWERARIIAYVTAQVNSTKRIKPTDVLKFAWDNTDEATKVSNEEKERLDEKAKQLEIYYNGRLNDEDISG